MADNIMAGKIPSGWMSRVGISVHGCERFVETSLAASGVTYDRDLIEEILVPRMKETKWGAVEFFKGKVTAYMIVDQVILTMRYTNDNMLLVVTMHDLDKIDGNYSGIAIAKKKLRLFIEKANRREAKSLAAMNKNRKLYRRILRRIINGKNKQR